MSLSHEYHATFQTQKFDMKKSSNWEDKNLTIGRVENKFSRQPITKVFADAYPRTRSMAE